MAGGQLLDEHPHPNRVWGGCSCAHPVLLGLHRLLPPTVSITQPPQAAPQDRPENFPEDEGCRQNQAAGCKFGRGILTRNLRLHLTGKFNSCQARVCNGVFSMPLDLLRLHCYLWPSTCYEHCAILGGVSNVAVLLWHGLTGVTALTTIPLSGLTSFSHHFQRKHSEQYSTATTMVTCRTYQGLVKKTSAGFRQESTYFDYIVLPNSCGYLVCDFSAQDCALRLFSKSLEEFTNVDSSPQTLSYDSG